MDPTRRALLSSAAALALAGCTTPNHYPNGKPDDSATDTDSTGADSGADDTGSDDTGDDTGDTSTGDSVDDPLTVDDFGEAECEVFPFGGEGPFYFSVDQMRRDITEGEPGAILQMGFRVLDVDCNPIRDAVVDVWHCDAIGVYAGFEDSDIADETVTHCRGLQPTDADGIAEFRTVYPGWYPGRTIHIHIKVHLNDSELVTTQSYMSDDITDIAHTESPYVEQGERQVRNEQDGGYMLQALMDTAQIEGGYRATISMVVRQA